MSSASGGTRTYLAIWGWLAGLMLIGVFLSELPIPKMTIVLLVLALSSIKALLVALYYMHLKMDRRLLALVALAPIIFGLLRRGVGQQVERAQNRRTGRRRLKETRERHEAATAERNRAVERLNDAAAQARATRRQYRARPYRY